MTLADRIYTLRTKAGLTQEAVAKKCGVSSQSVQKWESDKSKPAIENLITLSEYFGVSLDELLTGSVPRQKEDAKRDRITPNYEDIDSSELYSEQLMTEYRQSVEEGLDIENFKEVFEAVSHMPKGENKEKMADVLFDIVINADKKAKYEYTEPTDYNEILKERAVDIPEKRPYDEKTLRDKIAGAWYGRICGCLLGKPVEGVRTDKINIILKETGNYPLHRYIKRSELTDSILERAGEWIANGAFPDVINCAPNDDDTNYMVLYQELIEKFGRDFTSKNVADFWIDKQSKYAYYTAERTAFINFVKGFMPPASAVYKNPFREWIGAQIRGDYFGYINPGDPETAANMAHRDAAVSHIKNGVYGEMFASALIAESAVEKDLKTAIKTALKFIPQKSRFVKCVNDIIEMFESGKSEDECFNSIHSRYDEYSGHDWCHTLSNAEIVTASLLYGNGDYSKSICRAVQTGFDTDCNGATVGSVIGMMKGISAVGREWTDPINGRLSTQIFGVGTVDIEDRINLTLKHIKG